MPTHQGRFVWDELVTTDVEGAKKFYTALVPWTTRPWDDDGSYTLIENDGVEIGGIAPLPAGDARKTEWMPSVYVYDLDACLRQVPRIGGTVVRPPEEIPSMGCWAIIAGPEGARISIYEPGEPPKPPREGPPVGHFAWHELLSNDWKVSWEFYRQLFNWERIDEHSSERLGTYLEFGRKGAPIGGMFTRTADMPAVNWTSYIACSRVTTAVGAVRQNGGQVMREPSEVPGGSWIAICSDPQGAMFALTSREK